MGLSWRPQSSTATKRLICASPVSLSISTTQICVPKGKTQASGSQNIINRDSKLISNNLGKCCLLTLSMRGRASVDHNIATLLNSDTGALVETNRRGALGPYAANLDIGGEANAHQLALSTFLGLFCTQIIVVRQLQGFIQRTLVIAGIINRSCNRLVRELVRLDEVES